jgi:hypothetical protein
MKIFKVLAWFFLLFGVGISWAHVAQAAGLVASLIFLSVAGTATLVATSWLMRD